MSGFSTEWLRLREAIDRRSRNTHLLAQLSRYFGSHPRVCVFDLGAGLGSNLRALMLVLPKEQRWTLVDNDPVLLAALKQDLSASRRAHSIEVCRHDLAADAAPWGAEPPDLVTAAALFDLVSEDWIDRFVRGLAKDRLPFYTALTHDGTVEWSPAHPADPAMNSAFRKHFGGDKGFGPSLGGRATGLLAERLQQSGYSVERAPSPWVLGPADKAFIRLFAQGWADAVRATGEISERTIVAWLAARTADGIACTVGHDDLLALPIPGVAASARVSV